MKKLVTVVTPTYNESENVDELYRRVSAVWDALAERYRFELIVIDNASQDDTAERVKALSRRDPRVKLIVNVRNFGHIRSPYHGLLQAHGDAVIYMASDLQDPPELMPTFLDHWESGAKIVLAVKETSRESPLLFLIRRAYYRLLNTMADVRLVMNATGFGLYDQAVMKLVRQIDDPYPYFRGLVAELGFPITRVPFVQPLRYRGITKNNFYSLYDLAMLGITNHSKVPLRLATMAGFSLATLSLAVAMFYLAAKLLFWDRFPVVGQAPTVIGLFFFGAVQLFFVGILGEYIGAIHTQVLKRPAVVEAERFGFEGEVS